MIASILVVFAESLRSEGYPGWAIPVDVERPIWTPIARIALAAGLVVNALV